MKLSELAGRTGARADERHSDIEIKGAAGLDEAEAGHVAFLANPRYTPRVQTTRASAVYVGEGVEVGREDIATLRARDPYLAYTRALRVFHPEEEFEPSLHPSAVIDPSAQIGQGVAVGACSVIGRGAFVGDRVRIFPNVTVYEGVHIGEDCVIHAGQVGVAGHLEIGDDAVLTAKNATSHNVPAGKMLSGIPAFDNREWLRSTAAFRRLGEMQRTLRTLEQRLAALEKEASGS